MLSTPKWMGLLAVAFVAGSFIASPELRAYAANTIGSSDIIDESIQSADIKNGQVKASDIATDAVGAAEIQGVNKLIFAQCKADSTEGTTVTASHASVLIQCTVSGVDADDSAIATTNGLSSCFVVGRTLPGSDIVRVLLVNQCSAGAQFGTGNPISILVFDK